MLMPENLFQPAVPILFVRDVSASSRFYRDRLGFVVDFLYGTPPFYGSVSRGQACLHLRHVGAPNFAALAATEPSLILATIEVTDVHGLYEEFQAKSVDVAQMPTRQDWGGTDLHIRDPDGNVISFVTYTQQQ
jgi:catechol 2,3-dioxygenase-like lactoylglutathione lyase family enzyme